MQTFKDKAARLDTLEDIADEWIGGAPNGMSAVIAAAEAEAMAARPLTTEDRAWLAARLLRAVANDWTDEAKAPLLGALARADAA